ncbi:MAG: argininosuccinate lyase [Actinomycetota bacterium]
MTRLWGGRFAGKTAPEMVALSRSTHFDVRLVREDCAVLAAHAGALQRAGILSAREEEAAREALRSIATAVATGAFPIDPSDEDVHTTVERALAQRLPDVADRIRAGLSRNDRVVTAFRLWLMRAGSKVHGEILGLIEVLLNRGREHAGSVMPGYTHLQRAQPVTLGAALAAHGHALARDAARIGAAIDRADEMPLGAGALAGSTLALDHTLAAAELGFARTASNSLDAVASRDFALEFLAACAIAGVTLSRLAEEIVLWTSAEFGFATLDDAYATGSSLMPQKKNPDVAELARGKAGRLIGDLTGLLAACKGLPLAYNRDLQEDKEPVFDAADTLLVVIPALSGAVRTMRFDESRLREAASDPVLLATDLAEHLVSRGAPFARAHEAVGRAVRDAAESGRDLRDLTDSEWKAYAPEFETGVAALLDLDASVKVRMARSIDSIAELEAWLEHVGEEESS